MFEQLEGLPWYRTRPNNSGFFAVVLGLVLVTLAPWVLRIIVHKARTTSKAHELPHQQEKHADNKRSSAVEIIAPPQIVNKIAKAKPAPVKCRCHIDTQAPGQDVVHHNTQFTLCNVVEESDQQWRQGFYFRAEVRMRWHCTTR
jgi:hypothetical protein